MSKFLTRVWVSLSVLSWLFAGPMAAAAEHQIIQKDKKFNVTTLTIHQGDKVTFTNKEKDITHNVFSLGPKNEFELKTQKPGSSNTIEFKDIGTTEVECAIHPTMKMVVQVEPSSAPKAKK